MQSHKNISEILDEEESNAMLKESSYKALVQLYKKGKTIRDEYRPDAVWTVH